MEHRTELFRGGAHDIRPKRRSCGPSGRTPYAVLCTQGSRPGLTPATPWVAGGNLGAPSFGDPRYAPIDRMRMVFGTSRKGVRLQGTTMSAGARIRDSVLECYSPLELFASHETDESAGGPAHSRTLPRGITLSAVVCRRNSLSPLFRQHMRGQGNEVAFANHPFFHLDAEFVFDLTQR